MKRFVALISALFVLFTTSSCLYQTRQDKVLASIGKYDTKVFYSSGGFQDFTDYAKYSYSSVAMENNPYFSMVSASDIITLYRFIDNFEEWIDVIQRSDATNNVVINYNFDRSIVDTGDYFYIYEDEDYPALGCYDVFIFDVQTNVLYYFHNNI